MSFLQAIVQTAAEALAKSAQPSDQRPPSRGPPSRPPSPYNHRPHVNEDLLHHDNPHYQDLRTRANNEGDLMAQCFQQSHEAYERGDGAQAKTLSEQGKAHQREMESLNAQASDWVFRENNKDKENGEVDLHGLYVKEAITYADRAIQDARQRGDSSLRLIVGKGLHSAGHVAKLKPAIEDLINKHQISAHLDPNNEGVLIVVLDGSRGRGIDADEITRKLESDRESCIIM